MRSARLPILILYCQKRITEGRLTYEAEPRRTDDVDRDSGTASANRRWLRRIVRDLVSTNGRLHNRAGRLSDNPSETLQGNM